MREKNAGNVRRVHSPAGRYIDHHNDLRMIRGCETCEPAVSLLRASVFRGSCLPGHGDCPQARRVRHAGFDRICKACPHGSGCHALGTGRELVGEPAICMCQLQRRHADVLNAEYAQLHFLRCPRFTEFSDCLASLQARSAEQARRVQQGA